MFGLIASTPPAHANPANPLAGSAWQLVALQSMDDAIGRRTPAHPSAYTLRFGTDGMAVMRLDCNRGRASWQASVSTPSQGRSRKEVNGSLRFGPLALTRAFCPPPSLSDSVARQLPFVRSFLLRDNRLFLSLLADGGILEWQPLAAGPSSAVPDPAALAPDVRRAILAGLDPATRRAVAADPNQHRVLVARIDLNGDGRQELLTYLMGPLFCGTGGCTLQLFTPQPSPQAAEASGTPWRLVQTFSITRLPLIAAPTTRGGWRDLWRLEAGGGRPSALVRERFDGQSYRPSERRPPQPPPTGTPVFPEASGFANGVPL